MQREGMRLERPPTAGGNRFGTEPMSVPGRWC